MDWLADLAKEYKNSDPNKQNQIKEIFISLPAFRIYLESRHPNLSIREDLSLCNGNDLLNDHKIEILFKGFSASIKQRSDPDYSGQDEIFMDDLTSLVVAYRLSKMKVEFHTDLLTTYGTTDLDDIENDGNPAQQIL